MHKYRQWLTVFFLLVLCLSSVQAKDQKPTATPTANPTNSVYFVEDGNVEKLGDGDNQFIAIYKASSKPHHGAILLFNELKSGPNSDSVIRPLRLKLPTYGWSSLSISLNPDVKAASQNLKRINLALSFLKKKKAKHIYIISYGDSAYLGLDFAQQASKRFQGIILLSAFHNAEKEKDYKKLIKDEFPIFDIVGSVDYYKVLKQAKQRKSIFSDDPKYRQLVLLGADHFYSSENYILVTKLRGWMRKQSGIENLGRTP